MIKLSFRNIFFILLTACIAACTSETAFEKKVPGPIAYSVAQKSAYFNEKNISVSIDSMNNVIYFNFTIKKIADLPFPVNQQYKDTLSKTAFHFELHQNNKILSSDYQQLKNSLRWITDTAETALHMIITSDTIDLKQENVIRFQIPMYAFHDLKKGKQSFELFFSQSVFVDEVKVKGKDNATDYIHLSERKPLLNGKIKFDILLPPIYKSIIFGEGLTLRNDSAFSPAGMDNTLWNSSYPDIYWCIFYPEGICYAQTPFEKSTDSYEAHDTFNLYHYYKNDSVGFGVYDHDNLSHDDGLGFWYGSLDEISQAKYTKVLRFGNVSRFNLKIKESGLIN